jgi:hypothetical protein
MNASYLSEIKQETAQIDLVVVFFILQRKPPHPLTISVVSLSKKVEKYSASF